MARLRLGVFGCDGVVQQLLAGLVAALVILGGLNGLIVILLLFSLWHASCALGVRLTLAFFAITTVTSWIFEEAAKLGALAPVDRESVESAESAAESAESAQAAARSAAFELLDRLIAAAS